MKCVKPDVHFPWNEGENCLTCEAEQQKGEE